MSAPARWPSCAVRWRTWRVSNSSTRPADSSASATPSSPGCGTPCSTSQRRPELDMRVLIADDEPTSRLLLKAIVSRLGHECLVAEDGSQAWELLSRGGIDVLLTDWMMPGVDGPALCRRVREELIDTYIYIVLTTGLDYPERVLEGMSAGADDYLTKPVDSFSVQTRLVAAERVTHLHGRLAATQAELAQANVDLLARSLTDDLTGLGNRRRMEEDLARTHARAVRTERSYGIALF